MMDGIDVRQIAPSDLRENIGFSAQDTWLMSTSIEQNISLSVRAIRLYFGQGIGWRI